MDHHHPHLQEIQLFSPSWPPPPPDSPPSPPDPPSLDLDLSISVTASTDRLLIRQLRKFTSSRNKGEEDESASAACVEALKWEAAEQIRVAAMERAYAERVRELTRREMELAQTEFARARHMWERAREEADRADRIKEKLDAGVTCMDHQFTCHSCRQKFRPS